MIILMAVGAMLATLGVALLVYPAATAVSRDAPSAEVIATAMLVYHKAAVDWCLGPLGCADGLVPPVQLTLPPGYAAPWLSATASNGIVSTIASGLRVNAMSIAGALGNQTAGGPSAGVVSGGNFVVSRGVGLAGRAPLATTALSPGTPVVTEKVR